MVRERPPYYEVVRRVSYWEAPADYIIFKDGDYVVAKDGKIGNLVIKSDDANEVFDYQFAISHGLVAEPSKVQVTPMSADAAGDFYVTKDATNIYVNYKTAPASGTDNVVLSWYAEV